MPTTLRPNPYTKNLPAGIGAVTLGGMLAYHDTDTLHLLSLLACYLVTGIAIIGLSAIGQKGGNRLPLQDLITLIGLGFLATGYTYYLQTNSTNARLWQSALIAGLLANNLIIAHCASNLKIDQSNGNRTLTTLFGSRFSCIHYSINLAIALLLTAYLITGLDGMAAWLPLLVAPMGLKACMTIGSTQDPKLLNSAQRTSSLLCLAYALFFTVSMLLTSSSAY